MKCDQGLGIIGAIVLATLLAMLLTVGIPISVSKDGVELKDWLGFAGNVFGAMVTLGAAFIAFRAVQNQIEVQQEATRLSFLMREEDRIESDIYALRVLSVFLRDLHHFYVTIDHAKDYYERLTTMGLSKDVTDTTQALRERLAAIPATTDYLLLASYQCAALVSAAESLYRAKADWEGDLIVQLRMVAHNRLKSKIAEMDSARAGLIRAADHLEELRIKRESDITAIRQRIISAIKIVN